jgi:hypothetical protein
MFQFVLFVLSLIDRLGQRVLKDRWCWDFRPRRAVSHLEGWVSERQWAFYARWFRVRAFLLTRDPLLRQVFATHLLYRGANIGSYLDDPWWKPYYWSLRRMFDRPDPGYDRDGCGIAFYAIGHNSSHDWSAGVKDGKLFIRSCGEEFTDVGPMPEQGEGETDDAYCLRLWDWEREGTVFKTNVREVPPGESWGYAGHF